MAKVSAGFRYVQSTHQLILIYMWDTGFSSMNYRF